MKAVRLSADAEHELDQAFAWYARERPHRLEAFALAYEAALASVGATPAAHPLAITADLPADAPEVRQARVARFPWRVVYFERPAEVFVVAMAHVRREPGYWRERLR
jgi:plasmid stabilization system protein ParE